MTCISCNFQTNLYTHRRWPKKMYSTDNSNSSLFFVLGRKCIAQTQFLNNKKKKISLTRHWDKRNHWSALFLYVYEKSVKVLNMRKHLRNRIRWWSMTIRGGRSTNIGSKLQWEVNENIEHREKKCIAQTQFLKKLFFIYTLHI